LYLINQIPTFLNPFFLLAGVDFKIKFLTVGGKKLKLTIWDTGMFSFPVSDSGPCMFVICCLVQQGQLFIPFQGLVI